MRAKTGHPVLREVVARITEETLERKRAGMLREDMGAVPTESLSIIEWTGPAVWTDSVYWGMNRETKTGKGTKAGGDAEEWSWVQFTGITEPKVPTPLFFPITCLFFAITWLFEGDVDGSKLGIFLFCRLLDFLQG